MLACADLLLPRPITWRDHVHAAVKRVLLRYVDLIILFQKDFSEYQRYYGLRPEQLRHVPFKTNLLDIVQSISPRDAGYYWSGGTTYRDWSTLSKALDGLDIPVVITIPDDEELRRRGEADDDTRRRRGVPAVVPAPGMFGSNVRIVRHGADPRSWIDWAAGARGAVLPIHPRTISSSGVSTYLTAMALRKPLIITEVASTIGILDQSTAMLVPPADPAALRKALLTLDGDPALRQRLAEASYRYAASASDTPRLHSDYLRLLLALAGAPVTDLEKAGLI
jgi:hypothetical protein